MSKHPEWALKHKRKGTELRLINGKYYLYEVTSKWDPEKKRPRKITGKLLGKITKEDGFIESPKRKLEREAQNKKIESISIKEYGASALIIKHFADYQVLLKKHFPQYWRELVVLAYGRLVHHSPLKNMQYHYQHSYLSEQFKGLKLSPKSVGQLLRQVGKSRERIVAFFREFAVGDDNILFDGTDLISHSEKLPYPELSLTKKGHFDRLINLMLGFSTSRKLPLYYRILPGNIKDVKAVSLSMKELGISDAVFIMDKGFFSKQNIEQFRQAGLRFLLPLKRNHSLIDYSIIESGDKRKFHGHFMFQGRVIWYYTYEKDGLKINVYLDEELKNRETKDYLRRVEAELEGYEMEGFFDKQYHFGTLAILHNTDKDPQTVYEQYKARREVEEMIDVMKNVVKADRTYMQDKEALEGWMFINYLALHWYYRIYQLLVEHKLIRKYSVSDILLFLRRIFRAKINNEWAQVEITKKTQEIMEKLKLDIT